MKPEPVKKGRKFPWVLLLLLILTAFAFWVLPNQWKDRPVSVTFEKSQS